MQKKKLILIHGLNNNIEALGELGRSFSDQYEVVYLTLPHHHKTKPKDFKLDNAVNSFETELLTHIEQTEFIIAYSMGCSYLQYLLEHGRFNFPMERVIYLSPALKTKFKLSIFGLLPGHLPLPSFAPVAYRLRPFCYSGQYRTLLKLTTSLSLKKYPAILADPKDELISLKGLSFTPINRDYLPYGKHHLSFHPNFYQGKDWEMLIDKINEHLRKVLTI